MPRIKYTIEIQLDKLLARRATAHLVEPHGPEYETARSFIRNMLHQRAGAAQSAANKISVALQHDLNNFIDQEDVTFNFSQDAETEEALKEALVVLGVWDEDQVLTPEFCRKLGLEDQ